MDHKLNYSKVCLTGRFNAKIGLQNYMSTEQQGKDWRPLKTSEDDFKIMQKFYYPSLLRSMMQIGDEKEQLVCRYELIIPETDSEEIMLLKKDGKSKKYPCQISNIRIWIFKYEMVLFSIEIEESPSNFSELTEMHKQWKDWNNNYESFHTPALDKILTPLMKLANNSSPAEITYSGTKMRQFQLVETDKIDDELLYEIGSFSNIGVVSETDPTKENKPSDDYYSYIIKENTLSVFSNWKALALNDSFTIMSIDDFFRKNEYDENFELLYVRCLLEEFYCFDRNNLYHENKTFNSDEIEREITYMERHYFYDNMSYSFLPPLMYNLMAKGIGLSGHRRQLVENVKKSLQEARHQRENYIVNFAQIFAVITVIWTFRDMLAKVLPCTENNQVISLSFALVAVAFTVILIMCPLFIVNLFHKEK